jgi:gliding motility associated protien GldN
MRKLFLLSLCLIANLALFAQNKTVTPPTKKAPAKKAPKVDGFIYREATAVDTVVPYAEVKPEDVFYTKRVWREIDFRDPGNIVFASSKVNLIAIIYNAVSKGELDLYASNDEEWKGEPISAKKSDKPKTTNSSSADTAFLGINPSTNEINRANNEFFSQSFLSLRVKEDWILDIKRGIFEPRIIGVAPIRIDVKTAVDNNGNPIVDPATNKVRADTVPNVAGWIYFDDLRPILVANKIANNNNDNSGINFDNVFLRRLFYSNITKVSNTLDSRIEDILFNPKERLLESEKIKKALFDFEQGLWEY